MDRICGEERKAYIYSNIAEELNKERPCNSGKWYMDANIISSVIKQVCLFCGSVKCYKAAVSPYARCFFIHFSWAYIALTMRLCVPAESHPLPVPTQRWWPPRATHPTSRSAPSSIFLHLSFKLQAWAYFRRETRWFLWARTVGKESRGYAAREPRTLSLPPGWSSPNIRTPLRHGGQFWPHM